MTMCMPLNICMIAVMYKLNNVNEIKKNKLRNILTTKKTQEEIKNMNRLIASNYTASIIFKTTTNKKHFKKRSLGQDCFPDEFCQIFKD